MYMSANHMVHLFNATGCFRRMYEMYYKYSVAGEREKLMGLMREKAAEWQSMDDI